MTPSEKLTIHITVSNTGSYDGEEVTQLYIRDMVASVARPLKQLRGFQKTMLRKGESKTLTFTLGIEDLKFYDEQLKWTYEPGDFQSIRRYE